MAEFEIFQEGSAMRQYSRKQRKHGKTIAFVPTMGCLHEGHISLIELAGKLADIVIVSIYVNPTQFSKSEDFGVYPKQLAEDHARLKRQKVSAVFQPASLYHKADDSQQANGSQQESSNVVGVSEIKPGDHETFVQTTLLEKHLCGQSRPHFFRGVATVVTKLFNIVEPDIAVFGSKDYQQLQVIRRLVRDLDFDIQIEGGAIVREPDGLAMSSRNALLDSTQRGRAACIFKALQWAQESSMDSSTSLEQILQGVREQIQKSGGRVDYVEVVDKDTLEKVDGIRQNSAVLLVAVFYGTVRLIDNIRLYH